MAEHLKGISTFGKAAEMTAHNAFVRINENRQLVGMPLLIDAPEYKSDVPVYGHVELTHSDDTYAPGDHGSYKTRPCR